ncbi:hypothetical protein C8R45DRAFT_1181066 [Mycena sanguinolenta]|nr:hypothetical protein C8R45DRAFT_1181066 [Mycena sanguinolenta]
MSLALDSRSWSPDPQIFIHVVLGLIVPGVGLTTVLLTLYGYAAWNPVSRRYLDRVSFRLLTYALVAHVCFGISFTITALAADPGRGCPFLSFLSNVRLLALSPLKPFMTGWQQLTLVFSAAMFSSIAINLPLVLVFNVNGRKMEKYYVIGVTLVVIVSNVPGYASGNVGWDDVNETCWFRSEDPTALLRWLIGSQTVWILLASIGEVVAFMVIVGYLVAYRLIPKDIPATYSSTASPGPGSTIRRFRNIILRIGLYPLVSCIVNISITVIEFYLFENHKKHVGTPQPNWRLNLAVLIVYAGRSLMYVPLAATDPSFIRALNALRHPENEWEAQSQVRTSHLEMSTVVYLPQDAISINEQHQADTPGFSTEAQSRRGETSTVFIPGTNSEMDKMRSLADGDGTRTSIDLMSHI